MQVEGEDKFISILHHNRNALLTNRHMAVSFQSIHTTSLPIYYTFIVATRHTYS